VRIRDFCKTSMNEDWKICINKEEGKGYCVYHQKDEDTDPVFIETSLYKIRYWKILGNLEKNLGESGYRGPIELIIKSDGVDNE